MLRPWQVAWICVLGGLMFACASELGTEGRKARKAQQSRIEREGFRGRLEGDGPEEGELKRGSGISQLGLVVPGGRAEASPLVEGVDLDRLWSEFDDWEPIIAADRSSDHVYAMTTRLDGNRAWVILRISSDAGVTFGPDHVISRSTRAQYDPQLAVAADGTVFAVWLEVPRWETMFSRSFDHGVSWSVPITVETNLAWTDHPWLTVSDDGQDVYVAFNKTDSWVVASHDGGVTFERPVRTHQTGRTWYHTGGAVAPDGAVYFGGAEYHPNYNGPTRVNVLRSVDGGATFQKIFLDRSQPPPYCGWSPGCYWGFNGPGTGLAVDPAGTVLFAYSAGFLFAKPHQIYVRTSTDGLHWSERQLVSFEDPNGDNAFPVVVAGPLAGDFSVVWQSDRDGDTSAWNTWMRRTLDGGQTWGPFVRLSTRPDGAPYKSSKGYSFPYGDYMSATADGVGRVHALWGAGASYNGPGGTWYTRTKL